MTSAPPAVLCARCKVLHTYVHMYARLVLQRWRAQHDICTASGRVCMVKSTPHLQGGPECVVHAR